MVQLNVPRWIPQHDRCPCCREEMPLYEIAPNKTEDALEANYYCSNAQCDHFLRKNESYQYHYVFAGKGYVTKYLEFATQPNTVTPAEVKI